VDEAMKICREVWERYQKSPEPKSDALKRELINALALAQASSLENPLMDEIQEEINAKK
jgi:hypothetical protein